MPSILLTPCDITDYSASAELLSISPVEMQEIADRFGFDDPQFLSRLDRFEEHLNSDLTFEQYVNLMDELPCPCPTCITSSGMTTVEYAIAFLQKLQTSWATLLNVVEPYSTPPNSPIGEEFPYEPPSVSPTNREMHAMNGNHIYTKVPFVRDVADVLNGVHEAYEEIPNIIEKFRSKGKYSSDDAMRHYKKHFSNHPSGRYYDAGTPEYDEWWKLYQETLKTPQLKKLKKITNKEQHAKNGNPSKWSWKPTHGDIPSTQTVFDREAKGENPANIVMNVGPTNKEMHSYNGNPPKFGPRTKAQHARTERKKIRNAKKRAETKAYLNIIKKGSAPFPQNRPRKKMSKAVKQAARIESREARIARQYMRFLQAPQVPPPRLGSTGMTPTKIMHGVRKISFNMSSIQMGTPVVANATCITACLNPTMFSQINSATNFACPILIGVSTAAGIAPSTGNTTADFNPYGFDNGTNLLTEVLGTSSANCGAPLARWLGGSITLDCRCPMTTTAPPSMFGGLLKAYPNKVTNGLQNFVDLSKQINVIKPEVLRALPESVDKPGFTVSSVYAPATTTNLQFDTVVCSNVGTGSEVAQINTPIPYVGCVNCPTSAVVTITVSSWFEIQPFINTQGVDTSYYSGWKLGPRISTEDVFDHLRSFPTVTTRVMGQSVKNNAGASGYSAALMAQEHSQPIPRQLDLVKELEELKQQLQNLRVQIDSEEDEKYFDIESTPSLDKQDTPIYKGLSKSTLDLAMTLKKSLTPGSVTHKAVQSSSQ